MGLCPNCGYDIPECKDCGEECGPCGWYHESGMCKEDAEATGVE